MGRVIPASSVSQTAEHDRVQDEQRHARPDQVGDVPPGGPVVPAGADLRDQARPAACSVARREPARGTPVRRQPGALDVGAPAEHAGRRDQQRDAGQRDREAGGRHRRGQRHAEQQPSGDEHVDGQVARGDARCWPRRAAAAGCGTGAAGCHRRRHGAAPDSRQRWSPRVSWVPPSRPVGAMVSPPPASAARPRSRAR